MKSKRSVVYHQTQWHMYYGNPRRRGEKEADRMTKIMAKNFSNLMKDMNLHIQEAQWTPSRLNSKRFMGTQCIKT